MKISIIIPTYKRANFLEECLDSILNQSINKKIYEVIVISDGFDKNTDDVIKNFKKYNNLKYFKKQHGGPASARNKGLKYVKGEIITFLDDDCVADKNWIKNIIRAHQKYKNALAIGGYIKPYKSNFISEFGCSLEEREHITDKNYFLSSLINNTSYKNSVIKLFKKFDESFITGEDVEFNYRLYKKGIKTLFIKDILIKHHYREDLFGFLRQQIGFGSARAKLFIKCEDYPYDRKIFLVYFLKMLFTPFLDPLLRFRYALLKNKRYKIGYIFLGYLQQLIYWSAFVYGLLKR